MWGSVVACGASPLGAVTMKDFRRHVFDKRFCKRCWRSRGAVAKEWQEDR